MLVHIKELLEHSQANQYAIGAFNVYNLESALGVARGAQSQRSPVIIQVSESTIKYAGLKPITHIVTTIAKNIIPEIPVALHLDHGKTFESVIECINAGFTSVHIDASSKPLDENIAITQAVIEYAHERGVYVQGEVGMIIGGHGETGELDASEVPLAEPADVAAFIKATNVDSIAAAVGTAHGVFTNEEIHFDLLTEICSMIEIPFVLHGASGVSDDDINKTVATGVNIINIGTDIKHALVKTIVAEATEHPDTTDPRSLLQPAIDAVAEVVKNKTVLFKSANQVSVV